MTAQARDEEIVRRRMHGLYLSRDCSDIVALSEALLGLHCWFHRNVCFSALIRGADIIGWKTALTKTWLYRGTLHGVAEDDLPRLLALHTRDTYLAQVFGESFITEFADEVIRYMEDGVYSRAEFRRIFAAMYEAKTIEIMFSPWGGIFVHLAKQGRVAFRDMTSRDFDLISAEPQQTFEEVLPDLLRRYFAAYGPATLADAAWFFGIAQPGALRTVPLDEYDRFQHNGKTYYCSGEPDRGDIPEITLLSGFDPLIVSYVDRSAVLPAEHKSKVVLKSGICLPTVAVHGRVAGIWNIKKNEPVLEFFTPQPRRVVSAAMAMVDAIRYRVKQA